MISIVNVDENPRSAGPHKYEIRVNNEVIGSFIHSREDELSVCFDKASYAAKVAKQNQITEIILEMEGFKK